MDLSAIDLLDRGEVIPFGPPNLEGVAICCRFKRTSLEPCLFLPIV